MRTDELHPRTLFDLAIRRQVFQGGRVITVPRGSERFWDWYARTMRFGEEFKLEPVAAVPEYPPPDRGAALWYSGGAESTYSLEILRDEKPDLLSIEDYEVFTGPDRRIGQVHFICAAVAAGIGYRTIYLGMERDDFLLSRAKQAQQYAERDPLFTEKWSGYQPLHELRTVCGHLPKEEIIRWLAECGILITGTCDRRTGGSWCGECYKCFEAFYFARAVDVDLGIRLVRTSCERYYAQYRRYVDSRFADNFNNSYHRFVRLQMQYHITIDPEQDCAG